MMNIRKWCEVPNAVVWIIFNGVGGIICSLIFAYIIFFTKYWPASLVYLGWFYYDRKSPYRGGYRKHLFRYNLHFKYLQSYFPLKIVKTANLDPEKNYIFGCHPHGVISPSAFGTFMNPFSDFKKIIPGFKLYFTTIDIHFNTPFYRDYMLNLGGISCSRDSLEFFLTDEKKGKIVLLYIGGAPETAYSTPGNYRIILRRRKGFVKLALKTGTPLVPVFGFGDNDIFEHIKFPPGSIVYKIQKWILKKIDFFLYLPTSIIPKRIPITTVVGEPIHVPHIPDPSIEEINYYHSLYTDELIKLFNNHKMKYLTNGEKAELEIVE